MLTQTLTTRGAALDFAAQRLGIGPACPAARTALALCSLAAFGSPVIEPLGSTLSALWSTFDRRQHVGAVRRHPIPALDQALQPLAATAGYAPAQILNVGTARGDPRGSAIASATVLPPLVPADVILA